MIGFRPLLTLLLATLLGSGLVADPDRIEKPATTPRCVGGCAAVKRTRPTLESGSLRALLACYRNTRGDGREELLDRLLFHWESVSMHFAQTDPNETEGPDLAFLRQEVGRNEVRVHIAVRDDQGRHLFELDRVVPIGKKQHLHARNPDGSTRPIASFTAERVALDRVWFRL